jgi:hypothetical protein
MPAGIPKRLTDELGKLGVTLDPYHVAGTARLGGIGPAIPAFVGIEVKHRGRVVGVAEQKPRGWGGDNKWRTYPTRTPDGSEPTAVWSTIHTRQKDSIAAIIRMWM